MNFNMAAEMAAEEDIDVQTVLVRDDISSAPPDRKKDRRGVAGLLMIVKIAGAASQTAGTLDELVRITTLARDNTRSLGVAMKPGSIPATGKPTFELPDDELEIRNGRTRRGRCSTDQDDYRGKTCAHDDGADLR